MLKLIYLPFKLFQAVPLLAFLPAALFVTAAIGLGRPNRASRLRSAARGLAFIAATLWALYAIWELVVSSSDPAANIRVDLLLIAPILISVTILAVVFLGIATLSERESLGS